MEINDLIDERNARLYLVISERMEIELKENPDWRAEAWDSHLCNTRATLLYCDYPTPVIAFTKELLRVQAQLKGFRLLAAGQTTNSRPYENMQTIIKSLNHHFLNHKIARDFVALGYPQEQFQEEDHSTAHFLKDQLLAPELSPLDLSILYLLFIEPSAMTSAHNRAAIQGLFSTYGGGKFTEHFQRIDTIMQDWALADTYFAEKYMMDFLINAGVTHTRFSYQTQADVSHEKDLPEDGFYVD